MSTMKKPYFSTFPSTPTAKMQADPLGASQDFPLVSWKMLLVHRHSSQLEVVNQLLDFVQFGLQRPDILVRFLNVLMRESGEGRGETTSSKKRTSFAKKKKKWGYRTRVGLQLMLEHCFLLCVCVKREFGTFSLLTIEREERGREGEKKKMRMMWVGKGVS
ncbi:hypothetical protein T439DRAFT_91468 [Meredithblackwellia eburnea MCA 4105]